MDTMTDARDQGLDPGSGQLWGRGLEDTDLSSTNARQRRELVPKPTPSGRCAARVEEEGSQEAPVTGADSEGSRGGLSPMAQGWGMENADL